MDIGRMFLKRNVWWQKHWWLDSFQNGFRYNLNPKDFTSIKFVYQHVIWSFFSFFFIKGPKKAFIHLPNEKGLWILQGTHFTASWMKMERNEVDTSDGLKTWMHINKDMGIRKSGDMQNFTNNDQRTMTSFGGNKTHQTCMSDIIFWYHISLRRRWYEKSRFVQFLFISQPRTNSYAGERKRNKMKKRITSLLDRSV